MRRYSMLVAALCLGLAGCQTSANQMLGATIGSAAGAVIGSKFGKGSGNKVALAGGALIGALVGGAIGQALDEVDKAKMASATQKALENQSVGQATTWKNPDSGNSGTVVPTRTIVRPSAPPCREYRHTVMIGDRKQTLVGTACRQADGSWVQARN